MAAQETTRREVMISRVENAPLVGIQLIKLFKLEDWLGSLSKAQVARVRLFSERTPLTDEMRERDNRRLQGDVLAIIRK